MIKAPLFPCRLAGRDIVTPAGLVLATVGALIHEDHARQLVDMLNAQADPFRPLRIEYKSEIPPGAWIYCPSFGWLVNRSEILTPEIRMRQGFTHYSTAPEKPAHAPHL